MKNKLIKIFIILGLIITGTISSYAFSFRNMTLDFIHITDTHISSDRSDTTYKALGSSRELLNDAILQINDIQGLDFVMFTGDMVDSATPENFYEYYKVLTKLKYPTLNSFGNHEYYGDMTKEEVLNTVKEYNPNYIFNDTYYAFSPKTDYRIIVLDPNAESYRGTSNGEFSQEQLQFLDNELSQNQDKVIVICMHHPSVEPFVANEHQIVNADEFNEILLKYKNPIVVLTGHYHATKLRHYGNLVFVSTPAMVTYPMAFRHIKITNYKDRVVYHFDFIPTRLEEIRENNRQGIVSYSTLAGLEFDRNTEFIFYKKHPKSVRYKRNKIHKAAKITKTSKRDIKKLSRPKKIKSEKPKKERKFFIRKNKKAITTEEN